jgi:PEP-CTERM motif
MTFLRSRKFRLAAVCGAGVVCLFSPHPSGAVVFTLGSGEDHESLSYSWASATADTVSQCAAGGSLHPGCSATPIPVNQPLSPSATATAGDVTVASASAGVNPEFAYSQAPFGSAALVAKAEIPSGGGSVAASGGIVFSLEVINSNSNVFKDAPPVKGSAVKVKVTGGYIGFDNASGSIPAGSASVTILDTRGLSGFGTILDSEFILTDTGLTKPNTSGGVNQTITLYSYVTYQVTLFAGVDLSTGVPNCCEKFPAYANLFVDPTFVVDPGNPDAADYVISLSANLAPFAGSAVPEPSTWAILLFGLAGLGYAGVRRAGIAPTA